MIRNEGHSLIGMDFLSRFRMTIDLKHQEMLLERSANYAQRVRLSGLPSILVAKQQGEYVVYDVLPSSAAAQAGIHAGDTIEQVDGQILSQFSAGAAQDILNGYAETKAEIVVKGSGRKTIHYTRQSLFAMPHGRQAGIGIGVTISEKGTLMIETVDNYSPAQEAGLKVGDQIKAINGLPVSTTPFDRLAAEMTKPAGTTVVLQVIHSGSDKPEEFKLVIRRLL